MLILMAWTIGYSDIKTFCDKSKQFLSLLIYTRYHSDHQSYDPLQCSHRAIKFEVPNSNVLLLVYHITGLSTCRWTGPTTPFSFIVLKASHSFLNDKKFVKNKTYQLKRSSRTCHYERVKTFKEKSRTTRGNNLSSSQKL